MSKAHSAAPFATADRAHSTAGPRPKKRPCVAPADAPAGMNLPRLEYGRRPPLAASIRKAAATAAGSERRPPKAALHTWRPSRRLSKEVAMTSILSPAARRLGSALALALLASAAQARQDLP